MGRHSTPTPLPPSPCPLTPPPSPSPSDPHKWSRAHSSLPSLLTLEPNLTSRGACPLGCSMGVFSLRMTELMWSLRKRGWSEQTSGTSCMLQGIFNAWPEKLKFLCLRFHVACCICRDSNRAYLSVAPLQGGVSTYSAVTMTTQLTSPPITSNDVIMLGGGAADVGPVTPNTDGFIGCIDRVVVNNEQLSLLAPSTNQSTTPPDVCGPRYTHSHTHTHTHTHSHVHVYTCTHTHTCTHTDPLLRFHVCLRLARGSKELAASSNSPPPP